MLPTLSNNSIDAIVTDPPYELGFMGKKWDSSGIAYSVELWTECLRVLKPGGHLLSFGGTRTWHRVAVAIEDAGFEIRDNMAWLYGSGFPKSLDVSKAIDKGAGAERAKVKTFHSTNSSAGQGQSQNVDPRPWVIQAQKDGFHEHDGPEPITPEAKQWQGWGTALKPAHEPIVVARKPLIGTVAENVLTHGTGGLNIDGSRIEAEDQAQLEKNWDRLQSIAAEEGRNAMSGGLKAIDLSDRKAQGRWPANILLDEYTAELLDKQSGTLKSGTVKPYVRDKSTVNVDFNAGLNKNAFERTGDSGGASRFFYVAKASKRDRNEGLEELEPQKTVWQKNDSVYSQGRNPNTGEQTGNEIAPRQNFHPTVKPTDLMRYLIKLVTPPGGIVLDPFTGSGSTGKAAILEGFDFIGIELTEEYLPIIKSRLKWAIENNNKTKIAAETKEKESLF